MTLTAAIQASFKHLVEAMEDASVLVDINHSVVAVNSAFEQLFGLAKEEVMGKTLWGYIVPADNRDQAVRACQAVATGETVRLETVRRRRDGQLIPVSVTIHAVVAETRLVGIWGVYVELSRPDKTAILRERETRLRDFVHAIPDTSFVIDETGQIVEAFGNVKKLLGKADTEIINLRIQDLFSVETAQVFLSVIQETIRTGLAKYYIREIEMDGKSGVAEERVVPLRYTVAGKKTAGVIVTDITDRQRMEKMLFIAYEMERRSDLINAIIFANRDNNGVSSELARQLGIDLSQPLFCCLLRIEGYAAGTESVGCQERRKIKGALVDLLGDDPDYLLWDCHADIGILCQVKDLTADADGKRLVSRIEKRICRYSAVFKVNIGVGSVQYGAEGLRRSWRQAMSALLAARCLENGEARVYYYRELGLLKFLINYSEEKYAAEFIEDTIGPLLAYDRQRGSDLLATLESIVRNFTLQAAAAETFLHPKTVYYRKQRIETVLGRSLDSADIRLAVSLAIALYKLKKCQTDESRCGFYP
ncbi:MAG: PAS domain S-box protein [Sporomusaceae bacterium]|nr:PAS domain S-box protein [Sporomusaceae bacterium]